MWLFQFKLWSFKRWQNTSTIQPIFAAEYLSLMFGKIYGKKWIYENKSLGVILLGSRNDQRVAFYTFVSGTFLTDTQGVLSWDTNYKQESSYGAGRKVEWFAGCSSGVVMTTVALCCPGLSVAREPSSRSPLWQLGLQLRSAISPSREIRVKKSNTWHGHKRHFPSDKTISCMLSRHELIKATSKPAVRFAKG